MTDFDSFSHFKECLRLEILDKNGKKKFSWFKVFHRVTFSHKKRFYFWWRLANYLHSTENKKLQKRARKINYKLRIKYGTDISVEAFIGPGMKINHYVGIVIRAECKIGKNLNIRQNTTIGRKDSSSNMGMTIIGDNVDIGAHTCIIGDITIGDDTKIGAASFINKDIPSNCVVFTHKTNDIRFLN